MTKKKKEENKITLDEIEEMDDREESTIMNENDELISEETMAIEELNPEKHKTFLRLAKPRVQKVLDSLRILGNCSNRSSYDYTSMEIDTIFTSIYNAVENTCSKFEAKKEVKNLFEF